MNKYFEYPICYSLRYGYSFLLNSLFEYPKWLNSLFE
jgi:hypothetical protein